MDSVRRYRVRLATASFWRLRLRGIPRLIGPTSARIGRVEHAATVSRETVRIVRVRAAEVNRVRVSRRGYDKVIISALRSVDPIVAVAEVLTGRQIRERGGSRSVVRAIEPGPC